MRKKQGNYVIHRQEKESWINKQKKENIQYESTLDVYLHPTETNLYPDTMGLHVSDPELIGWRTPKDAEKALEGYIDGVSDKYNIDVTERFEFSILRILTVVEG